MLQESWAEITGWGLILSGLSLATWALGEPGGRKPAQAAARPESAPRLLRMGAADSPRRLDQAGQWSTLMDIAERGFLSIEIVADLQDRAREEVEAADEALRQLIIECAAVLMPEGEVPALEVQAADPAAPQPMAVSRPLAA
jgi:hypothetical protein